MSFSSGAVGRCGYRLGDHCETHRRRSGLSGASLSSSPARRDGTDAVLLTGIGVGYAASPRANVAICPFVTSPASFTTAFTTATGVAAERGGTDDVGPAKGQWHGSSRVSVWGRAAPPGSAPR